MKRSESNRIFIDCEWNDYRGELISMALVAERGDEFYQVLGCENPSPWVAQNVMPSLAGVEVVSKRVFVERLREFLGRFLCPHIIADWPEDIEHLCKALIIGPGERVGPSQFRMEVFRLPRDYASAIPHNALEDARALRTLIWELEPVAA